MHKHLNLLNLVNFLNSSPAKVKKGKSFDWVAARNILLEYYNILAGAMQQIRKTIRLFAKQRIHTLSPGSIQGKGKL